MVRGLCLLALLCSCGFGIRAGSGISRSSSPTTLMSSVDPDTKDADASASASWVELEGIVLSKYARGLFAIGGGSGHTRLRSSTGMNPETISASDSSFATRLGAGIGVSPVTIGPLRPIPYTFYNINWGPDPTGITSTLELGVDVEFESRLDRHTASAFVVGAALIRESGQAQATFTDVGTYDGTFSTTGFMVTFGWHYLIESFNQ
jgi:hypothetical protein